MGPSIVKVTRWCTVMVLWYLRLHHDHCLEIVPGVINSDICQSPDTLSLIICPLACALESPEWVTVQAVLTSGLRNLTPLTALRSFHFRPGSSPALVLLGPVTGSSVTLVLSLFHQIRCLKRLLLDIERLEDLGFQLSSFYCWAPRFCTNYWHKWNTL